MNELLDLGSCRRGIWAIHRSGAVSLNSFGKNSKRLIEEISCTTQCDVDLLKRFLPSTFLMEGLKTSMMFFEDRLFRIKH
jgi:hypothetical protein